MADYNSEQFNQMQLFCHPRNFSNLKIRKNCRGDSASLAKAHEASRGREGTKIFKIGKFLE
jgi:hypothetical protein